MKKFSFLLFTVYLFIASCSDKNNTSTPKAIINIAGFEARDFAGNPVAHFGDADNDWTFINTLSEQEKSLFNFNTSFSLDNTAATASEPTFFFYPNPCKTSAFIQYAAQDSVVFKIVIVDSNLNVLKQFAQKDKLFTSLIDFNDRSLFPIGSSRRVYYSLSAKNAPDFKIGYGDIKICDATDPQDFNSCF